MLIETTINIMLIMLMERTSIALGMTRNKPDVNQTLLTIIDIMIAIEIIKPIIRIEHKQISEENIGARIIKKVTTETSLTIRITMIIMIRNGT